MPEMTAYRHGVPCWIDVSANDVGALSGFYRSLFGWEEGADLGPEAGGYRMFTKGGLDVAGIGPQMQPGMPTSWTTYIAVTDADAVAAAVSQHGGTLLAGPMDLPNGSGRIAIAMDVTGGVFGLFQAGNHLGARLVNEEGSLVWNELTVRDADAAAAFYEAVFGWTVEPMDPSDPSGYRLVKIDGRTVAGCMPMGPDFPEGLPTHWLTYFAVADVEGAVARCSELGGATTVPLTEIPMGRFAVLSDPDGAVFSVMHFNDALDDPNDWPA